MKKFLKRKLSFILIFLVAISAVSAQDNGVAITGEVKDANGELLPGVSVVEKGTTNGTITGIDGSYSVKVNAGSTVIFSFIGFQTQEVVVGNQTVINITLNEETTGLDEVVVVGYGSQKKANLTGAVQSIQADVLENRPIASVGDGLQGVAAGLNVTNETGAPGAEPKINIRGYTSINGGEPLVLVDGVERPLNLINPDDVASITVLKDAASAAIYGSRAAFGVLLVTTKAGKKSDKAQVSLSSYYGFNSATVLPEQVNGYDYMLSMNEWNANVGSASVPYDDDRLQGMYDYLYNGGPDYEEDADGSKFYYRNTEWNSQIFDDAAPVQKHNVSISGGSDNITYYASYGYYDQTGLLKPAKDNYQRNNVSLRLDAQVVDWLKVGADIRYNESDKDEPTPYNNIMGTYWHAAYRMNPLMVDFREEEGYYPGKTHILAYLEDGGRKTQEIGDTWYTFRATLTPLKNLTIKSDYTRNRWNSLELVDYKKVFIMEDNVPVTYVEPDYVQNYSRYKNYEAFNAYAEYNLSLNQIHNFKVMAGYNQEETIRNGHLSKRNEKLSDAPHIALASGDPKVDGFGNIFTVRGGFYRLNYDYKGRYLIETNGRYDGTSRFSKDSRFAFYPSISAGWRVSEEPFMSFSKDFLDNFKLRASYAAQGNQTVKVKENIDGEERIIAKYYPYLGTMSTDAEINYLLGEGKPLGINPANAVDPNVTWETVSTLDFGVDMTLLNGKIDFVFDWYKRETKDMLLFRKVPALLGSKPPLTNGANLETKGFELTLKWRDNIGGFKYDIALNLADYQAEITKYENESKSLSTYYEGQKMGEIWGFETQGIFKDQTQIDELGLDYTGLGNERKPGDVWYKDQITVDTDDDGIADAGDGAINKGQYTLDDHGDLKVIGNTTPRYIYGINTNMSYKGFDLNVFFQGVAKRDIWVGNTLYWGHIAQNYTVPTQWSFDNYWRAETDADGNITGNNGGFLPRNIPDNVQKGNMEKQTRYLQNGAYLRLKNVTLGYTLPKSLTEKAGIQKVRFYVSGQNLITFTKFYDMLDPEGYKDGGKIYPFQKTVAFGANVTF